MTVLIDKKIIHIGWGTAVSIILFLVVTVYGTSAYMTKYLQRQDDIYNVVKQLSRKDSMYQNYAYRMDTIGRSNNYIRSDNAAIKKSLNEIYRLLSKPKVYRSYTQRRINGETVMVPLTR